MGQPCIMDPALWLLSVAGRDHHLRPGVYTSTISRIPLVFLFLELALTLGTYSLKSVCKCFDP